ncbi:unnamed protein product [Gulo gulo]|uniref:Uncharacterized protein n=1 Tax=Gulo gulo TaxID=48420 RepID=A0A9X9PZ72_GULGU|nr:unnamed protein product [Gulo gulo]
MTFPAYSGISNVPKLPTVKTANSKLIAMNQASPYTP